jgi:hypothetical protein
VELLADRFRTRLRPDHGRICLSRRGDGQGASGRGSVQLLGPRHRQHGGVRALRHAWRAQGPVAEAAARGQDPLGLSDDRAGRRLLGCDQHRDELRARRRPYVLNGEKWWSSGAGDPRCKIYIVMVRTPARTRRSTRHSMILVPADTPGITKLRAMKVYGDDDAPHGHMHIRFDQCARAGRSNLLLGEGQRVRDRAGPARAGPHPSLHARHRPGGDRRWS